MGSRLYVIPKSFYDENQYCSDEIWRSNFKHNPDKDSFDDSFHTKNEIIAYYNWLRLRIIMKGRDIAALLKAFKSATESDDQQYDDYSAEELFHKLKSKLGYYGRNLFYEGDFKQIFSNLIPTINEYSEEAKKSYEEYGTELYSLLDSFKEGEHIIVCY